MALPTFPAQTIDGQFLKQATLFFECELDRIVDGFGVNSLIAGRIVDAHILSAALRGDDIDDQDALAAAPLLAYLSPGRYAEIRKSQSFPFPEGFQRSKDDPS